MPLFIITILAFLALEAFILAAGHYYPNWSKKLRVTLPDPRRLITNYTYGTLAIFVPYTLWVATTFMAGLYHRMSNIETVILIGVVMWVFVGTGGMAVKYMYWHDGQVAKHHEQKNMQEILELQINQKDRNAEHDRQR